MILSAASFAVVAISAVAVAPTTSEAIPAFARQTGAACLSCHFQSFPALNAFGRSFKEGALTDVGEQALIEDDDLSIPSSLNISLMVRPGFVSKKTTSAGVTATAHTINATADQVMMVAGRIGSNTGAFVEIGFQTGPAVINRNGKPLQTKDNNGNPQNHATPGGGFNNVQLFNSWDMGGMKVGATFFKTGFGEDSGLQLMSVWGQHSGVLAGGDLSINTAMGQFDSSGVPGGNGRDTAGVTVWAANDMGAIQFGLVDPALNTAALGGDQTTTSSWQLAPMVRANGFFEVGDMTVGIGAIVVSGQVSGGAGVAKQDAKRWGIDAQIQGSAGDMQYGVYADYASAAKSGTKTNIYNASKTSARTGYSLRATISPIDRVVLLAGIGKDKMVDTTTPAAPTGHDYNMWQVGVEYALYQNFHVNFVYNETKDKVANKKTKTTTLEVETLM